MPTTLESLTSDFDRDGDATTYTITDDWLQGRAAFGGLVATLGLMAARHLAPRDRRLRALHSSFVRPAVPGPVRFEATLERDGRNLTQVAAIGYQDGRRVATTRAVFGLPLDPEDRLPPPAPPPDAPGPDGLEEMSYVDGAMPAFLQHFDVRWARGGMPYSGSDDPESLIWLRARDGAIGDEALSVLFSDAIPSPAIARFDAPARSSTVAWSVTLFDPTPGVDEAGWWLIRTRLTALASGYGHHVTTLWTPEGRPAAVSEQTLAVYP